MTALVERVVWVSLATSLLLLPLLGLSGAIRRRYRAGSCYLLWLVLALRLLIPLPVPVPVGTALSQVVPAPAAEETLVPLPGISGPASVRGPQAGGAGGAAKLTEALSWLWAAGAVLFLGVGGGGYLCLLYTSPSRMDGADTGPPAPHTTSIMSSSDSGR